MGLTYGPLGTILSELFPTAVRYTGASLTFNLAGIVGASLAPYIATYLARHYGLQYVGYYLSGAALLTFAALWLTHETKDADSAGRSEEHTSELQSLMRISYAVFCLKKKTTNSNTNTT